LPSQPKLERATTAGSSDEPLLTCVRFDPTAAIGIVFPGHHC
jgi:hypothetical protein